jgi:TetR/AcrR family transcriptional regulator, fatty acid biosynthesis regulator
MPAKPKLNLDSRPRRRGTRAETRERLLTATVKLLHRSGEAAISTVSVTRLAGIAQSAFYQHFASVEECLSAAAERVTSELRTTVADARQRMFDAGPLTAAIVEPLMRDMFEMAQSKRAIHQLFLRYRYDPLSLNGVVYRYGRGTVTDLAVQLTAEAAKVGLRRPGSAKMEALADLLSGACWSAIEAFLDGRGPGIDVLSRLLATFLHGATQAVFEELRKHK